MRMPTLRRGDRTSVLPGVTGPARLGHHSAGLLARVEPGDVVVLDHLDLDGATARELVRRGAAAVVNASPSTSGRFPNLGPQTLVSAGVPLVDGTGPGVWARVRDGQHVRLDGGTLYADGLEVASGTVQTQETVTAALDEARAGLATQVGSLVGDAADHLLREGGLLLDGEGVPPLATHLADRAVLVVTDDDTSPAQLAALRPWVRERRPVVLAVGGGADRALALALTPHLVLGRLDELSEDALRCGAEVVALTDGGGADDAALPGLGRARARGVTPVLFATRERAEDAAVLLAHTHGAWLVVLTGPRHSLVELLDGSRDHTAGTMLTRLRAGGDLVHADTVAGMHRPRISGPGLLLLVLSAALVVVATVLVSPLARLSATDVAEAARSAVPDLLDLLR